MYSLIPVPIHDEIHLRIKPIEVNFDTKQMKIIMEFYEKQQSRMVYMLMYGLNTYKKFNLDINNFVKEDCYSKLINEFNNRTVETLLTEEFNYGEILLWKENMSEEEKSKINMILELKK